MLDSGMRGGALGSTWVKNVEFNQYGPLSTLAKQAGAGRARHQYGYP